VYRKIPPQTQLHFSMEWDALAKIRYEQIASGRDISFHKVLLPALLELLKGTKAKRILDAGCGVGILTGKLAALTDDVEGVDPSQVSIGIARELHLSRAKFTCSTLEEFAEKRSDHFDVVVANMVLMDVPELGSFMTAVQKMLAPKGKFLFSVTHPWFWPEYYGYADQPWFQYDDELFVEGPFRISRDQKVELYSTHVHRPLRMYAEAFHKVELSVETLLEPMPTAEVEALYPKRWKVPRYLVGLCRNV